LNFKHLRYFWLVAKTGSIARASEQLHLTPQTLSGQIGLLEEQLEEPLFVKRGRGLELTDAGRLAFRYAQDIFSLGSELEESLRGYRVRISAQRGRCFSGIVDGISEERGRRFRLIVDAVSA
jgi:LysR family transcriptional activator of nhaA